MNITLGYVLVSIKKIDKTMFFYYSMLVKYVKIKDQ